jgi:hypothetical protein
MQAIATVVLAVVAAVVFGVVHDQVTARVCVEYFTIGHPPLFRFQTESPTLLAFGWGVVATWWVGVMLGIPLALAARAGSRPKINAVDLIRPLRNLMAITAVAAFTSGIVGYFLATNNIAYLVEPLKSRVPPAKHDVFIADLWAHTASYVFAFCGGLILIVYVRQARLTRSKRRINDATST